ncbi:hypothetical protein BC937DRAFT_89548 [Endogone sp. FLAS-F59071]|nr:hypothetical protein BC937DRAFT_89548 [Endogone sp. FLAS-F59071]|eukprot:RUS17740.1 hypothetical protein BC937DRAFT_89548 [Endogone sp. FLAS-F59071]
MNIKMNSLLKGKRFSIINYGLFKFIIRYFTTRRPPNQGAKSQASSCEGGIRDAESKVEADADAKAKADAESKAKADTEVLALTSASALAFASASALTFDSASALAFASVSIPSHLECHLRSLKLGFWPQYYTLIRRTAGGYVPLLLRTNV